MNNVSISCFEIFGARCLSTDCWKMLSIEHLFKNSSVNIYSISYADLCCYQKIWTHLLTLISKRNVIAYCGAKFKSYNNNVNLSWEEIVSEMNGNDLFNKPRILRSTSSGTIDHYKTQISQFLTEQNDRQKNYDNSNQFKFLNNKEIQQYLQGNLNLVNVLKSRIPWSF